MRPQLADFREVFSMWLSIPSRRIVIPLCSRPTKKLLLELKSSHFGRIDWLPFSETKRGGKGGGRWQSTCGGVLELDSNSLHAIPVAVSLTRHRKSPSPGLWCSTQIWGKPGEPGKLEDPEWYSHFCTKDEICHCIGP